MRKEICILLALCLLGCTKGELPRSSHSDEFRAQHEQTPVRDDEFDLTVEQLVQTFNATAKSCGQPYRMTNVELRRGALHDYFQQAFSDNVSLTAGVSKETGRITSITALASGKKGTPDRDTMFAIAEIIVLATNPDMTQKKAAAMIADMMEESRSTPESGRFPQRFFSHVRYVLRNDNGIGYWWIASPN